MKHIDHENSGIFGMIIKWNRCKELQNYHDSHYIDASGYFNRKKFYLLRGNDRPRKTPRHEIGYVVLDNMIDISEHIENYRESLLTHDVTVSEFCAILYGRGWIPFIDEYIINLYDKKTRKEIVYKSNDVIQL